MTTKNQELYPSISQIHEREFNIKGSIPQMTIYDYVHEMNKEFSKDKSLSYLGTDISYEKMFSNIEKVTKALKDYGVKKGDFVTVIMPNQPESVYLLYACSRLGAIFSPLDLRYPKDYLEHAVNQVDSNIVIGSTAFADKFDTMEKNTSCKNLILASPGLSVGLKAILTDKSIRQSAKDMKLSEFAKSCEQWSQFIKDGKVISKLQLPQYEPHTVVAVIGTGGTTGTPKLVEISNDNMNSAVFQCMNANFDFNRGDVWYDIMPQFIAFGLVDGLHLPLVEGMKVILEPNPTGERLIYNLRNKKINHMASGQNFYIDMAKSAAAQDLDLSGLKSPILGGNSINVNHEAELNKFLNDHGSPSKIKVGWGLTECCGAASAPGKNEFAKPQAAGITMPMVIVSTFKTIENPDGSKSYQELPYVPNAMAQNVSQDLTGELCVSGPNVMEGYYNDQENTNHTLIYHDGHLWLHTGDIGYVTDDGEVYLIDRSKEFVARRTGFKTPPKEIENIILLDPAIDDVKVVGFDNPTTDNDKLLKVYYTLKPQYSDVQEIEERLQLLCEVKLPSYKRPACYECIESMPLTKIGKTNIKFLQDDANKKARLIPKEKILKLE